ncbi:MAG: ATP-binding protein [Alphaproteobacteria bacterium]
MDDGSPSLPVGAGPVGNGEDGATAVSRYTRPLIIGYVVALVLVAILVTASYTTITMVIAKNEGRTDLVNEGGRQRMIVTRIALLADRMVDAPDPVARERFRQELEGFTAELNTVHDGVFYDRAHRRADPTPDALEDAVHRFLAAAIGLSRATPAMLNHGNPDYLHLQNNVDGLVSALDRDVQGITADARRDFAQLTHTATAAFILILGVLVLESLLIFLPLLRRTKSTFGQLLTKQRELAEARDTLDARVEERTRALVAELAEHRRTRDRLAASEQRYRSIVEDQTELICRFRPDTTLTYVNDAYVRFVGRSREDVVGHCFAHCLPDDQRAEALAFYASFTTDVPVREWEHEMTLPDGSVHWMWWRDRAIFDDAGQLVEFQAVGQDITGRRRVENALRTSEARLRLAEQRLLDAIENIPDGFVLWDAYNRLVLCNRNYRSLHSTIADDLLPGVSHAKIVRHAIERSQYMLEGASPEEWFRRLIAAHESCDGFLEVAFCDGRWVSLSNRRTSDGGVVGICTDITASTIALRNLAERELSLTVSLAELDANARQLAQFAEELEIERDRANAANVAKSQFLANMSHELRTPLNAIMGFSDMYRHETFGPLGSPKYYEYADHIHVSGEHLLSLINDILDMSKIEAGKFDLHQEKIDLRELVKDVLTLVAGRAAEGGLTLRNELPSHLPPLVADHRAIKQVITNLMTNAVKFTHRGGTVTVSAWVADGCVSVAVADTGIGIAPEHLSRVFEPFVQVERERNTPQEGTGLGLSLSRSLTRMHGGTLEIESELDHGTTVTMTLPLWPIQ